MTAADALPQYYFSCLPNPLLSQVPVRRRGTIVSVFWAIIEKARGGYECCPKVAELMAATGLSKRAVQMALRWLCQHKWIEELPDRHITTGRWFRQLWRRIGSGDWEQVQPIRAKAEGGARRCAPSYRSSGRMGATDVPP